MKKIEVIDLRDSSSPAYPPHPIRGPSSLAYSFTDHFMFPTPHVKLPIAVTDADQESLWGLTKHDLLWQIMIKHLA